MENKQKRIAELKADISNPNTPATLRKLLEEELAQLQKSKSVSSKKKDLDLDPMAIFNTKTRELVSRGLMPHEADWLDEKKKWKKNKDLVAILDVAETDYEIKNQKPYVKKDVKVKKIVNYGDWGYEFEPIFLKPESNPKKEIDPQLKAEAKRVFQNYLDAGGYEKIAKENALPLFPDLEKGVKPESVVMDHFDKYLNCLDYDSLADRVEFWQGAEDVTCENWEEFFSPKERRELMSIWKAEIKKLVVPKSKKKIPAKKQTPDRSDRSILKRKEIDRRVKLMLTPSEETKKIREKGLDDLRAVAKRISATEKSERPKIIDELEQWVEDQHGYSTIFSWQPPKSIMISSDEGAVTRNIGHHFRQYGEVSYDEILRNVDEGDDEFYLTLTLDEKWLKEKKPTQTKSKKKRTVIPAPAKPTPAKKKSTGSKKKASVKKKVEKSKLTPLEQEKVDKIKKNPKYKKLLKGASDKEISLDMKRKAKKRGKRKAGKGAKKPFYYEYRRDKTDEDLRRKI